MFTYRLDVVLEEHIAQIRAALVALDVELPLQADKQDESDTYPFFFAAEVDGNIVGKADKSSSRRHGRLNIGIKMFRLKK